MDERRNEPTPLELERWLLAEQDDAARAQTEARLDPERRARLRHDDAVLRERLFAALPPARLVEQVEARLRTQRAVPEAPTRGRSWAVPMVAAAACALALMVLVRPAPEQITPSSSERAKGLELELRVYRKTADGVERLEDGAEVRAHDVLQLGYVRDVYSFGVLLSIDGRGAVTLHQPALPSGSSALSGERSPRLLAEAYELDDAPEFERFILVVAQEPLSVPTVLEAARTLAKDPPRARREPLLLPVRTAQRSLLLHKPEGR